MRKTDLSWAAGFFDGEGSITMSAKETHLRLEVACSQKEQIPLLLFQKWFGGGVYGYKYPHKDICYQWKMHGAKAVEVLKLLLPYLVVKGEDAREVIDIWENKDYERATRRHDDRIATASKKRAVRRGLEGL